MPTVTGNIASQPDAVSPTDKFKGSFMLATGPIATAEGVPTTSIVAFSGVVTLTYSEESDLSGEYSFKGTLGAGSLSIWLANRVTIAGLVVGGPYQSANISGRVTWTKTTP